MKITAAADTAFANAANDLGHQVLSFFRAGGLKDRNGTQHANNNVVFRQDFKFMDLKQAT